MKRVLGFLLPVLAVAAAAFFLLGERDADDPLLGTDLAGDEASRGPADARLEGRAAVEASPVPGAETGFVLDGTVVDEAGRGLGGIPVVARPVARRSTHRATALLDFAFEGREEAGKVLEAATSAPDGSFAFRRLPPSGRYFLEARPAPPRVGSTHTVWLDRMPGSAHTARLVVRDGSPLRLRVVDATGAGRRAFVSAHGPLDDERGEKWRLSDTPTDGDGRLTLAAVPHPDVSLTVRVPGVVRKAGIRVATPTDEEVEVRIGATGGAGVTGRILDSAGGPIAGARVLVMVGENPQAYWAGERTDGLTTSAPDGSYTVSGLPALYFVSVSADAPGHCPRTITRAQEKLEEGRDATADVVLLKACAVSGRVLTAEGAPIPGASVKASTPDRRYAGQHLAEDVSDAEGRYRLEMVSPGALLLQAHADGFYQPELLPGDFGLKQRGLSIHLQEEGTALEKDVVLAPGVPLRGRIVDEAGRPAAGALVSASGMAMRLMGLGRGPLPRATADAGGRYAFAGLTPAPSWTFQARAGDRCSAWSAPTALAEEAQEPAVLDLTVRPSATIVGRLMTETGEPIVGTTIGLQPQHVAQQTRTDPEGRFTFSGLPAGTFQLHVYRSQYWASGPSPRQEVTVDWGLVSEEVVVTLPAGLRIAGIVVDEEGAPQPGATLWLRPLTGEGARGTVHARTGPDGTFDVTVVREGRYAVRVDRSTEETEVDAGTDDVRIVVSASATVVIEGTVLGPDGKPVPTASLVVHWPDPGGGTRGEHARVQDGRFRHSVPGATSVRVKVENAQDLAGRPLNVRVYEVDDVDPGAGPIQVRLEAGLVVAGRVVDASGNGVAGARVSVAREGAPFRPMPFGPHVTTGEDGSFRIVGLGAEDDRLTVQPGPEYAPPAPLTIAPPVEDVVVRLEAAAHLTGRVVGPDGEPVAGAQVYALWQPAGGGHQNRQTTTGADGSFLLDGLGAEPLNLQVSRPPTATGRWDYIRTHLRDVDPAQADLLIRLEMGVWIEGRVVSPGGEPVTQGRVTARSRSEGRRHQSQSASIGADGAFAVGPFSPGMCTLTAQGRGSGLRPSETVEVEAPATGVQLALRQGWSLEGRIRGPDSGGFQITLIRQMDGNKASSVGSRTDGGGRFSFDGLEEDTTGVLYARRQGDDRYALLESVRAGEGTYDLDLKTGRTIAGRIEGDLPEGVRQIGVNARGPHGISVSTNVEPGGDRTFELKGLLPGTWKLYGHVWGAGFSRLEEVEADAGATGVVLRAKSH